MLLQRTTPDDSLGAAVARLTPKERECLDRWLAHATAKEIALDLGITHHAVEKRLKSARAKLGVTSTLEAARLVAAVEGYGSTVSQSPELYFKRAKTNLFFNIFLKYSLILQYCKIHTILSVIFLILSFQLYCL